MLLLVLWSSLATVDGCGPGVMVGGGISDDATYDATTELLSQDDGKQEGPQLPEARAEMSASSDECGVILCGGRTSDGTQLDTCIRSKDKSAEWIELFKMG